MDNNFKISKKTKIVSLESAITDNIKPGNIVFLGGFGHAIHVEGDQDEKFDPRKIHRPYSLQYQK